MDKESMTLSGCQFYTYAIIKTIMIILWSYWWETDSHQIAMTPCLCYSSIYMCIYTDIASNFFNDPHIYIYIVIHRQTVSFYQNSSVWLDTQDARSRDRNPSNFRLDCVTDHLATKWTTLAKGIWRYFYF